MSSPPSRPRDMLLCASVASAPSMSSGEATAQVVTSAAAAAAAQRGADCTSVPRPEVMGLMADAVSELSLHTGARVPDVAYVTLCAAVAAARVADIDMDVFAAQLRRLFAAELRRPNCP